MIKRLPVPDKEHPEPRDEYVDGPLGVDAWPQPGVREKPVAADVPPGAPAWWKGEEEASQSFLRSMGVKLNPDGTVSQQ